MRAAHIGLSAVGGVVLVIVLVGAWFVWKRPLSVYEMMNRRALASAGLTEATVASPLGPQAFWSGGSGPTLVLLHGAGDSSATYSTIVADLVPKYRVVIPDLAGHAHSAPASGPISIGDVLTGLDAVMTQLPREPAIILGNSLGAWVAMLYARAHPDRVARLVLVNGGALIGERPDLSLVPQSRAEAASLMTQLRDPGSQVLPGFVLDDVVRRATTGPLSRVAQTVFHMGQYVLDGRLHEVQVPVDLIWGESDKVFSVAYARRMMAGLPASRLTTIPRCGHVPSQECPMKFRSSLLEVLAMAPPAPAPAEPRDAALPASSPGR